MEKTELLPFEKELNLKKPDRGNAVVKDSAGGGKPPSTNLTVRPKEIEMSEEGQLVLRSYADQLAVAQRLLNEGMISDTFKNAQQVVLGIQYAKALKIPELIGLRMMYVVRGRPSLFGEGPLALVQRGKEFKAIHEFYIDESGKKICVANGNLNAKVWGAVTQLERHGDNYVQEDFFTLEDLKKAGLDFSAKGKKEVWIKWERIMLRYKARTIALRSKFADLIAGVPVAEYDFHFSPDVPEAVVESEGAALVDELNKKYAPEAKKNEERSEQGGSTGNAMPGVQKEV